MSVAMQGNSDLMDAVQQILCTPLADADPAPPQAQQWLGTLSMAASSSRHREDRSAMR